MFKNKYVQFLLMFSPLVFCGFCVPVAFTYLRSLTGEIYFGGDCVESNGAVTISGVVTDMNNQPVEGVQMRFIKAEGACPQSDTFDEVVISDESGSFIIVVAFAVFDPEAQIEISADGYTPCRFNFYPPNMRESFTLQLTITLDAMTQVEGHVTNNAGSLTRNIETCS